MSVEIPALSPSLRHAQPETSCQACAIAVRADVAENHDEVFQVEVEVRTRGEHSGTFDVTCTLHDHCKATDKTFWPDAVEYTSPDGLFKRYLFRYPHQHGSWRTVALSGDMLDVASNKMLCQEDVRGWRVRTKGRRRKVHFAIEVQSRARYAQLIVDGQPHNLQLPWSLPTDEDAEYFEEKGDYMSEKASASKEMQSDKMAIEETEEDKLPSAVDDEQSAEVESVEDKPHQEAVKPADQQGNDQELKQNVSTDQASKTEKTQSDSLSREIPNVPVTTRQPSQRHVYYKEQLVLIIQNAAILHNILHIGSKHAETNHLDIKHVLLGEALQDPTTILAMLLQVPDGLSSEYKYRLVSLRDMLEVPGADAKVEKIFQPIDHVFSRRNALYSDFLVVFALGNDFLSSPQFDADIHSKKNSSQVFSHLKAQYNFNGYFYVQKKRITENAHSCIRFAINNHLNKDYMCNTGTYVSVYSDCVGLLNICGALGMGIQKRRSSSLFQDGPVFAGQVNSSQVTGKVMFSISDYQEKHVISFYQRLKYDSQNVSFPTQHNSLSVDGYKCLHQAAKQERKDLSKVKPQDRRKNSCRNILYELTVGHLWEEAERLLTSDWTEVTSIEKAIGLLQDILMKYVDAVADFAGKLENIGEEEKPREKIVFRQEGEMFTQMSTLGEIVEALDKHIREKIGQVSHRMWQLVKVYLCRKVSRVIRRLASALKVFDMGRNLCACLQLFVWSNIAS